MWITLGKPTKGVQYNIYPQKIAVPTWFCDEELARKI